MPIAPTSEPLRRSYISGKVCQLQLPSRSSQRVLPQPSDDDEQNYHKYVIYTAKSSNCPTEMGTCFPRVASSPCDWRACLQSRQSNRTS